MSRKYKTMLIVIGMQAMLKTKKDNKGYSRL